MTTPVTDYLLIKYWLTDYWQLIQLLINDHLIADVNTY